jgi:hypothetical protein
MTFVISDIEILKDSIDDLYDHVPEMVHLTYDRFAEMPGMNPEFLADRDLRERTLTRFLQNVLLESIRSMDTEKIRQSFIRLGIIYGQIGMSDDLLRSWGEIFVDNMEVVTSSDWSVRYGNSWRSFLSDTQELMVESAHTVRK